jgi:hypothetical protein
MNRFGILAEVRIAEDHYSTSVLEIIIAKNSVSIVSDIDLDKIKIGDEVNIEVVGKKFNLGDKKISVIGKIVKEIKLEPVYLTKAKDDAESSDEDVAEVVDDVDEITSLKEEEEDKTETLSEKDEDDLSEDKIGAGSDLFSDDDIEDFEDAILSDVEDDVISDAGSI